MLDASEIVPGRKARDGSLRGTIALAAGLGSHGEGARLEFDARGRAKAFWLGGTKLLAEKALAKELAAKFDG